MCSNEMDNRNKVSRRCRTRCMAKRSMYKCPVTLCLLTQTRSVSIIGSSETPLTKYLSQYSSNYQYPTDYALSEVRCPSGWMPYHTSCYKLFNQPLTFDEANKKCSDESPNGAKFGSLITGWVRILSF